MGDFENFGISDQPHMPEPQPGEESITADYPEHGLYTRPPSIISGEPTELYPRFFGDGGTDYLGAEPHPQLEPSAPDLAGVPLPEENPGETKMYPVFPQGRLGGIVSPPPESPLASERLHFVARGKEVASAGVAYTGKMEITDQLSGHRETYAEAVRYDAERPVPGRIITEDGYRESEYPERAPNRRLSSDPPDTIRVDILPTDPVRAVDVVETLLEGYVTDTVERLTERGPEPGRVQFKPGAVAIGYRLEPFEEAGLRDVLLGTEPLGITRIILNDHATNIQANQRNAETIQVGIVEKALSNKGCIVTDIQLAHVEGGPRLTGIEICFARRDPVIIDGALEEGSGR